MRKIVGVIFAWFGIAQVYAYEPDTHFSLTYTLARLACFSHKEALTIASADAAIDDCSHTDPFFASGHNPLWHALDDSKEKVLARKNALWSYAVTSKSLVKLGQYFHYQQDVYSHSEQFNSLSNFVPYGPTFGHAGALRQVDRPPFLRGRADQMAVETFHNCKSFLQDVLGRAPADVPDSVVIQLVSAQCDAYHRGLILNMWEEADADDVAARLERVAQQYYNAGTIKKKIRPPHLSERLKMEFTESGTWTNEKEINAALGLIIDYNFPSDTPEHPSQAGYIPPKSPVNDEVPAQGFADGKGAGGQQFHLESKVQVTLQLVDTGETEAGIAEWCYFSCKGKKHSAHTECDTSCDDPCHLRHGISMHEHHELDADGVRSLLPSIDLSYPGVGDSSPARDAIEGKIASFLNGLSYARNTGVDHFGGACGATMRQFGYRKYQLKAKTIVVTTGHREGAADITERKEAESVVATIFQPDLSKPMKTDRIESCACTKSYMPMTPRAGRTPTQTVAAPGPQVVSGRDNPNDLPPIHAEGEDLNKIKLLIEENMTSVYFPSGTVFVPNDRQYQSMMLRLGGIKTGMSWFAGPGVAQKPDGFLSASCLEIEKLQPKPGVVYNLLPIDDPVFRRLALVAESENVRGPWDQARTWAYTDHSTLDEINKKLIPGITGMRYVRCLQELDVECGANLDGASFQLLLDPSHLLSSGGTRSATKWLIQKLANRRLEALLDSVGSGWVAYVNGVNPDKELDVQHVADILDALDAIPNAGVHKRVTQMVAQLPSELSKAVMRKTKFPKL